MPLLELVALRFWEAFLWQKVPFKIPKEEKSLTQSSMKNIWNAPKGLSNRISLRENRSSNFYTNRVKKSKKNCDSLKFHYFLFFSNIKFKFCVSIENFSSGSYSLILKMLFFPLFSKVRIFYQKKKSCFLNRSRLRSFSKNLTFLSRYLNR